MLVSAGAPSSRRLIDPAIAAASLGLDSVSAGELVDAASAELAALLGFDPLYQSWTETLLGPIHATGALWLASRPVIEVTSVRAGGATATTVDSTLYVADGSALHRVDGATWASSQPVAYTVAYRAGWWCYGSGDAGDRPADVPALDPAIAAYALTLCRAIHRSSTRVGGAQRVAIRGASIERAPAAFSASLTTLAPPPRAVLAWQSAAGCA